MLNIALRKKFSLFRKLWASFILMTFVSSVALPPTWAQSVLNLPIPGSSVALTPGFAPVMIKGINLYPDQPFKFDFIIDQGESKLNDEEFKQQSTLLIKYFLASLTIPEDDMWVNLSPYEKNRIIQDDFGKTEMGRDLLAQDYMLKQLTASLMNPEADLGSEFWKRVYQKAQAEYGTKEIPLNTFNKIWIVPQKAVVYEHSKGAFITQSHLKVMLEEDYVAMQNSMSSLSLSSPKAPVGDPQTPNGFPIKTFGNDKGNYRPASDVSTIIREIILPAIEKEVNEGKTFANLRQIYNSVILAAWYKQSITQSLLNQVYSNQKKISGVDFEDKNSNEKIYNQYVESFKKGVFNLIKEDIDPKTQELIPRKYFSGGANIGEVKKVLQTTHDANSIAHIASSGLSEVTADMATSAVDQTFLFGAIFNAPGDYWESGDGKKTIHAFVQRLKSDLDSDWRKPPDVFETGLESIITAPITSMPELERLYLLHQEIWGNVPQLGFQTLKYAVNHVDSFILTDDRNFDERDTNKNWAHTSFDSLYVEQQFAIAEKVMGSKENLSNWFAENMDLTDSASKDFIRHLSQYFPELIAKYFTDKKFLSTIKSVLANPAISMKRKALGYRLSRSIQSMFPIVYKDFPAVLNNISQMIGSLWQETGERITFDDLTINDIIRVTTVSNHTSYLTVMDKGKEGFYLLHLDGSNEARISYFPSKGKSYIKSFNNGDFIEIAKMEVLMPKKEVVENPEAYVNSFFQNQASASSAIGDGLTLSNFIFQSDDASWNKEDGEIKIREFVKMLRTDMVSGKRDIKKSFKYGLSPAIKATISSLRDLERIFILHRALWENFPELGAYTLWFSMNHIHGYIPPDDNRPELRNDELNWPHTIFDSLNLQQQFVIAERALGSQDNLRDWFNRNLDMNQEVNQALIGGLSKYFPKLIDKYFIAQKFSPYIDKKPFRPMLAKQELLGYQIALHIQSFLSIASGDLESFEEKVQRFLGELWQEETEIKDLNELKMDDLVRVSVVDGKVFYLMLLDEGPNVYHLLSLDGSNDGEIAKNDSGGRHYLVMFDDPQNREIEKLEVLTPKKEVVENPEAYVNSMIPDQVSASSAILDSFYLSDLVFHGDDDYWQSGEAENAIHAYVQRLQEDLKFKKQNLEDAFELYISAVMKTAVNSVQDLERLYILHKELWENIPQFGLQALFFSLEHVSDFMVPNRDDSTYLAKNMSWPHTLFDSINLEQQFNIAERALGSEDALADWFAQNLDMSRIQDQEFIKNLSKYFPHLIIKYFQDARFSTYIHEVQPHTLMIEKQKSFGYRIALSIQRGLPVTYSDFGIRYDDTMRKVDSLWQEARGVSDLSDFKINDTVRVTYDNGQTLYMTAFDKSSVNVYFLFIDGGNDARIFPGFSEGKFRMQIYNGREVLDVEKLEVLTPKPGVEENLGAIFDSSASSGIGETKSNNVGGIDLNSKYLNIEIHRDQQGKPILFTPEELKHINIPGLVPIISNIQPIISLELLLKP